MYILEIISIEILKNIGITLISFTSAIGIIILYCKIFSVSRKLKIINNKIDILYEKYDKIKEDYVSGRCGYGGGENLIHKEKFEDEIMINISTNIQKLERKKKNLLEGLSLYQIFKK